MLSHLGGCHAVYQVTDGHPSKY